MLLCTNQIRPDCLDKECLYGPVARKKALLKGNHLKARLEYVTKHLKDSSAMWGESRY